MKRLLLILCTLMCMTRGIAQETADTTQLPAADDETYMYADLLMELEAKYHFQNVVFPRSSLAHPLTFRQQLEGLFGPGGSEMFTDAYVCISHSNGIEDTLYTDPTPLFDTDPIMLVYRADSTGEIFKRYWEPNVNIYLGYKAQDGTKRYVMFHMRVHGMLNSLMYARMSYYYPGHQQDALKNYNRPDRPFVSSYLTSFEAGKDSTVIMALYNSVLTSLADKLKNDESLTRLERYVLSGAHESSQLTLDHDYAMFLYEEQRYADAFEAFQRYYLANRTGIMNGDSTNAKPFYESVYYMAKCLQRLGVNDKATYYMGLAAYGCPQYADEYRQLQNAQPTPLDMNLRQTANPDEQVNLEALTVGEVLYRLFDIVPGYIQEGQLHVDGSDQTLHLTREEAWDYNLRQLCVDNSSTVTLRYDKVYYRTGLTDDKSILLYDNSIDITVNHAGSHFWRVNIMIPNFRFSDDRRGDCDRNEPLQASFIICDYKLGYLSNDLDSVLHTCMSLQALKLHAEAMTGLSHIYNSLQQQYAGKKMPKKAAQLLYDATIRYTAAMTDLCAHDAAIAYTAPAFEAGTANIDQSHEYVNGMLAIQDARAIDIINRELTRADARLKKKSKDKELQDYRDFLERRKAYVLIDLGQLDEAETIFKAQLQRVPDEKSINIIESELNYIQQLRRQRR